MVSVCIFCRNYLHAIKVVFYFSLIHSIKEFCCTKYSRESLELKENVKLVLNLIFRSFSDIYNNGKNFDPMNQKRKKSVEFALNCGYHEVQLRESPLFE